MATQQVAVGIDLDPLQEPVLAGVLLVERNLTATQDRSVGRFRYAGSYLSNSTAISLDPAELPLTTAEFRFARFGGLPGAFRDSAPDTWGRSLIERVYRARGFSGMVAEVDYLLASPPDRTGNLSFSSLIPPSWNDRQLQQQMVGGHMPGLPDFQQYVVNAMRNPEAEEVLALLTGAGGARPKVNIRAKQGNFLVKLAIADGPGADRVSMARVEAASLALAAECGITSCETRIRQFSTLDMVLVRRFDFDEYGRRRQIVSAMTVLAASDEPYNRTNWSYPIFARELDRWSADPVEDKQQLYRAMLLRAMLSDQDDHPRNYSLMRVGNKPGTSFRQWRLCPMYDCVAGMGRGHRATELAMAIGKDGYTISRENLLSEAGAFGMSRAAALEEVDRIEEIVLRRWKDVMKAHGVSDADIALTANSVAAFDDRDSTNAVERLMQKFDAAPPGARQEIDLDDTKDTSMTQKHTPLRARE